MKGLGKRLWRISCSLIYIPQPQILHPFYSVIVSGTALEKKLTPSPYFKLLITFVSEACARVSVATILDSDEAAARSILYLRGTTTLSVPALQFTEMSLNTHQPGGEMSGSSVLDSPAQPSPPQQALGAHSIAGPSLCPGEAFVMP